MAPIDEWLNVWLSAPDLAKEGEYRSPGPLQVYAMTTRGDGPQFGPNTGSGRYSLGADTKSADKVRIWYQAGLVTA